VDGITREVDDRIVGRLQAARARLLLDPDRDARAVHGGRRLDRGLTLAGGPLAALDVRDVVRPVDSPGHLHARGEGPTARGPGLVPVPDEGATHRDRLDDRPCSGEHAARARDRTALEHRGEEVFAHVRRPADLIQGRTVIPLGPERLAWRTPERVIILGQGRQVQDVPRGCPTVIVIITPGDQPAREVIRMPPRRDHDHGAARLEPGVGGRAPPVLVPLADSLARGFLGILDRVITYKDISATSSNRSADACRHHPARMAFEIPAVGGRAVGSHPDAEVFRAALRQHVPDLAPPARGEIRLITGENHPPVREPTEIPRRKVLRYTTGFTVTRGHRHDQPPGAPLGDVNQLPVQHLQVPSQDPSAPRRRYCQPRRTVPCHDPPEAG
jgi:hypothetical protein